MVGVKRDTIGIGMSKKGLMKMNIGYKFWVKGLVCSSNFNQKDY